MRCVAQDLLSEILSLLRSFSFILKFYLHWCYSTFGEKVLEGIFLIRVSDDMIITKSIVCWDFLIRINFFLLFSCFLLYMYIQIPLYNVLRSQLFITNIKSEYVVLIHCEYKKNSKFSQNIKNFCWSRFKILTNNIQKNIVRLDNEEKMYLNYMVSKHLNKFL